MQTVICITEDLWKVIHIVIGLVWFSLVQFGSHSVSFLPIQCFRSLQNVKVHITCYLVNILCSYYGLLGCNTLSSCLVQPTFWRNMAPFHGQSSLEESIARLCR